MQSKFSIVFLFVLGTFGSLAQENLEEKIWELNEFHVIQIEPENPGNYAQIEQHGQHNQLVAIQQLSSATENSMTILQDGNRNSAYAKQDGENHRSLLIQKGNNNEASLWSLGGETQNLVFQDGNNNFVNSYIKNSNSVEKVIASIQQGNNNRIELQLNEFGSSTGALQSDIEQTGNGNLAEVQYNQFEGSGISITQTGNPAPPVIVKQSDFSFPMK